MFGIGGWEFILIAVLALLLFGPDKLPQAARTLGRFMRDLKRYQSMMESTIRGEIFAADPSANKDPFQTGKEFRERVAGGGFTKAAPGTAKKAAEPSGEAGETVETGADATPAGDAPEVTAAAPPVVEEEQISAITGEIALDDDVLATAEPARPSASADEGEGERS